MNTVRERCLKIIKETIGKDKDLTIEDLKEFVSKYYHCNQFFNSLREMADKLNLKDNGDNYDDVSSYTDGAIKESEPYICFVISGEEFYPDGLGNCETDFYVQYNDKGTVTEVWAYTGWVKNGRTIFTFVPPRDVPEPREPTEEEIEKTLRTLGIM